MACDPVRARELGRIAARSDTATADAFAAYARELDAALAAPPTPGGHANALLHMFGYVSERLDGPARREFLAALEQYRDGSGTLAAPVRLLHAWIAKYDVAYLEQQYYFEVFLRR
jgi:uncharacterized protein YbgA (DUF1722 family)